MKDPTLPRPRLVNPEIREASVYSQQTRSLDPKAKTSFTANDPKILSLIDQEMVLLLQHDHEIHPQSTAADDINERDPKRFKASRASGKKFVHEDWQDFSLSQLQEARKLLDQEYLESGLREQVSQVLSTADLDEIQKELIDREVEFIPSEKRWSLLSTVDEVSGVRVIALLTSSERAAVQGERAGF